MTEVDCRHTVGLDDFASVDVGGRRVQLGTCCGCGEVIARRFVLTGPGDGPWTVLPGCKPVSEAVFERMVDGRVQRRLMRDPRYRNAENAEQQSEAEAAIEAEVVAELGREYEVAG